MLLVSTLVQGQRIETHAIRIGPGGKISFPPLTADVQAEGLTEYELSKALTQKLQAFTPDQFVAVTVQIVSDCFATLLQERLKDGRRPYDLRRCDEPAAGTKPRAGAA